MTLLIRVCGENGVRDEEIIRNKRKEFCDGVLAVNRIMINKVGG
jgi:hypothetical protein